MSDPTTDINVAALTQLAKVSGQLELILQMMHQQHTSTTQRINDFQHSVESRFEGIEGRLTTLEKNERGTALRAAGLAAGVSALVTAGLALLKLPGH